MFLYVKELCIFVAVNDIIIVLNYEEDSRQSIPDENNNDSKEENKENVKIGEQMPK